MDTFQSTTPNPFALMMDPESIFAAMARSHRLAQLTSRICRPLDKPVVARADGDPVSVDRNADLADR